MRARGGYAATLECGQHDDPKAVEVARHAIFQTLALLGLCALPLAPVQANREILRLAGLTNRAHADDRSSREWRSFDAVKAGEVIGVRHSGAEATATANGFAVFPNPRAEVAQEWFYFAPQRA